MKIGFTSNLFLRVKYLSRDFGEVESIATIDGSLELEKLIHKDLKSFRKRVVGSSSSGGHTEFFELLDPVKAIALKYQGHETEEEVEEKKRERMNVYLSPEDAKRFKLLKVDSGSSGPALIEEAFALLFMKHSNTMTNE